MAASWPVQDHSNADVVSDLVKISQAVEEIAQQQHRMTLLRLANLVGDWIIILLLLLVLFS